MASGKTSKAVRSARAAVVIKKPKPWGTIFAVVVVLAFAGGVFGYSYYKWDIKRDKEAELAAFTPSETNKDPSEKIEGVVKTDYPGLKHVNATQRVAYDRFPPAGGPHDEVWADCNGTVYSQPVRNENMVHALEHGAIWIAYNPDQVTGEALDKLRNRVAGKQYIMLSPYPNLDKPISLQSWGHQLKLDNPDDKRIDQFIRALQINPNTTPEPDATCTAQPGTFSVDAPPPFVGTEPGPDAVPMTGGDDAGAGAPPGEQPQPGQPTGEQPPPTSG